MKATLRKNGNMMITVRITAHIGVGDIADAIYYLNYDPTGFPTTRREAIAIAKSHAEVHGVYYLIEYDHDYDYQLALDCAEKLFPEMAGQ